MFLYTEREREEVGRTMFIHTVKVYFFKLINVETNKVRDIFVCRVIAVRQIANAIFPSPCSSHSALFTVPFSNFHAFYTEIATVCGILREEHIPVPYFALSLGLAIFFLTTDESSWLRKKRRWKSWCVRSTHTHSQSPYGTTKNIISCLLALKTSRSYIFYN